MNVDAQVGWLEDNNGTWVNPLLARSPAIDAGASSGIVTDQRGEPRRVDIPSVSNAPGGDGTDIGALELDHRLRITRAERLRTNLLVSFTSLSDKTYRLQRKSALNDDWVTLPQVIAGSGGIVRTTNNIAADNAMRVYRVQETNSP